MSNTATPKIVLVCTDCENTRILYNGITHVIPISHIITERPVSKKILIRRRIKKLGVFTVFSQLIFQALVVPLLRKSSRNRVRHIFREKELSNSPLPVDKVIPVDSVNHPEFIKVLRELNPDLVIVNGTRIISEATLREIRSRLINIHVGITPLYRGVHGAYWALAENDMAHCGVTIHAIDKGIDTGAILDQGTIEIHRDDNFITYPYLQFERAINLVKQVVPSLLQGSVNFKQPPPGKSRLWYHPTVWQYVRNRFRGVK